MDLGRRGLLAAVGTAAVGGCLGSDGPASLGALAVLNRDWRSYDVEVVFVREDFMDGQYGSSAGPFRVPAATYEGGRLRAAALVPLGSDWPDDVTAVGLRVGTDVVYGALDLRDVDPGCADLLFTIDPAEDRSRGGEDRSPNPTDRSPTETGTVGETAAAASTDRTPTTTSAATLADFGAEVLPCDSSGDFLGGR